MVDLNRRSPSRNLLVAGGLIFLITVTGCSGVSGSAEVSQETLRAASTLTEFPPEIEIAQSISVQNCLRRSGIDMPFDSRSSQAASLSFGLSNMFTSLEEAKRLGYTSTMSDGGDVVQQWEDGLTAAQRRDYYQALLGPDDADKAQVQLGNGTVMATSKEGCIAEGQSEVYGSVDAALSFTALVNEYLTAAGDGSSDRDASLAPLVPKFEECMREQDYDVESLGVQVLAEELFGAYRAPGESPSAAEQQLAAADYRCQQEVGLRDVVAESFVRTASDWLQANEGKLLAMQEELKRVKDRAITIINT